MKKNLLLLASALLLMFGCQKTDSYQINGDVAEENNLNGKWIYLSERLNREWNYLDSIQIENNAFKFTGEADSAKIVYFMFTTDDGKSYTSPFVLENGNIEVNLDTAMIMTIKGTDNNDAMESYKAEKRKSREEMMDIYKNAEPAGIAESDSIQNILRDLQKEDMEIDKKYSKDYVNTLVGSHIFQNSFYIFSIEEKEDLFSKMDERTKSLPSVKKIMEATEREKKTAVGQMYIDFGFNDVNGEVKKVSDFVGNTDYLLIDFWASWCGPCIASFPGLKDFYAKNKGAKFDILGVSLDDNQEKWKNAIEKYDLSWHHISDLKGWDSEGAKLYAINSIPATVVIDRNGKIVGRSLDLTELQELINQPVKE